MALSVTVLVRRKGCLGYERAQPEIVGDVVDHDELFVEHGQLLACLGEATMDITERTFDEWASHGDVNRTLRAQTPCCVLDPGPVPPGGDDVQRRQIGLGPYAGALVNDDRRLCGTWHLGAGSRQERVGFSEALTPREVAGE
jgi:hypothetical protein